MYITRKHLNSSGPTLQRYDNIPPRATRVECLPLAGIRIYWPLWPFASYLEMLFSYRRDTDEAVVCPWDWSKVQWCVHMHFLLSPGSGVKQQQEDNTHHQKARHQLRLFYVSACTSWLLRQHQLLESNHTVFYFWPWKGLAATSCIVIEHLRDLVSSSVEWREAHLLIKSRKRNTQAWRQVWR